VYLKDGWKISFIEASAITKSGERNLVDSAGGVLW
jgi:hypothetical protein